MNKSEQDRSLVSNLESLAYQAGELVKERQKTIYYSDFYEFYQGYLPYLRSLSEIDQESKSLILKSPQLAKPLFTNKLFVILLPAVLFFISPFNLIGFPLYLALLAGVYYGIKNKNQQKVGEINKITTQLIDRIKMKNSWN